jgi:hypothetical protein
MFHVTNLTPGSANPTHGVAEVQHALVLGRHLGDGAAPLRLRELAPRQVRAAGA